MNRRNASPAPASGLALLCMMLFLAMQSTGAVAADTLSTRGFILAQQTQQPSRENSEKKLSGSEKPENRAGKPSAQADSVATANESEQGESMEARNNSVVAPAVDAPEPATESGTTVLSEEEESPLVEETILQERDVLTEEDILVEEGMETDVVEPDDNAVDTGESRISVISDSLPDSLDQPSPGVVQETIETDVVEGMPGEPDTPLPDSQAVVLQKARDSATISETRSINFAKNLKDYRSPKLAMLMSLIIPGAGQVYAQHYAKAGLFAGVEAAIIGWSISYRIRAGDKEDEYKRFADKNYSVDSFSVYYQTLREGIKQEVSSVDTGIKVDSIMNTVIYFGENIADFEKDARTKDNAFYDRLKPEPNNQNRYIQGWKDCVPALKSDMVKLATEGSEPARDSVYLSTDSSFIIRTAQSPNNGFYYRFDKEYVEWRNDSLISTGYGDLLTEQSQFGFSDYYETYSNMVNRSRQLYRSAGDVLYLMVVNHLASAVDAAISAKRHNAMLLGQETAWNRLSVKQKWINTGSHEVLGCAVSFRF